MGAVDMTAAGAINHILVFEGGYVNDPDDAGGPTRFGISARAYPDLDIRRLTRRQAIRIYERDYWTPLRCEELPLVLRLPVLDAGVNQGVAAATRMLQGVTNAEVDGILGAETLESVRSHPATQDAADFTLARIERYNGLAIKRRSNRKFLSGWIERALTAYQLSRRF